MKKHNLSFSSYLMLLCCLFLSNVTYAKILTTKEITLTEALKEISVRYQVNFIYEDQTVIGKNVQDINLLKGKNIAKTLDLILPPLGLSWFNIDQRNYAIYPASPIKSRGKAENISVKAKQIDSLKANISGYIKDENGHSQSFATVSLIKTVDSVVIINILSDTSGFYHFIAVSRATIR